MNNNRLLVLLASWLWASWVICITRGPGQIAKIDVPGVSAEITKNGVDIEIDKPKK